MVSLFVRLVMVFLVASKKYRAEETKDGKFEDLIYTSMKSIVSLDELVTELSVQVAKLTTSLAELKVDVEKMRKDLKHTDTKLADLEDYGMSVLEKKVEKTSASLLIVKENAGETQKDVAFTKKKVVDLEEKRIAGLEKEINQLTTSVAETNSKVDEIDGEVTLISGEDTAGGSKCVKVCAGTTGRKTSNWMNYSGDHGIYTDVNMGSCGFIRTPTVTTSLEGTSRHWTASGTSSIYSATATSFRVYIYMSNLRTDDAKSRKYNVEWIAVGYTC